MNFFKKIVCIVLLCCVILSLNITASAESYTIINESVTAKVIQILDGNAIKVQIKGTDDVALVKLIGVDSKGYEGGFQYLTQKILGAEVTLSIDSGVPTPTGRWNNMYVTCSGVNINLDIIDKGYAKLDNSASNSINYNKMITSQNNARDRDLGIWNYGTNASSTVGSSSSTQSFGSGGETNINTATNEMLKRRLKNVPDTVVSEMIKYRNYNPFNIVEEVKFVNGFTKEMFNSNKDIMTVMTDINRAKSEELLTLGNMTKDEVDDIITYRDKHDIRTISELKSKDIISDSRYSSIKDFITVESISYNNVSIGTYVVNINTATEQQLTTAGISKGDAKKIIDYRSHGYTYKTLFEVAQIPGISLSIEELNKLEDNLHVKTDVNNANDYELRSVFSSGAVNKIKSSSWLNNMERVKTVIGENEYNQIERFIYVGKLRTNYVNINTATSQQLNSAGFSPEKISMIISARNINTSSDIPFDLINSSDAYTSLYTNINIASESELQSLGISQSLVDAILNYRAIQPFGNDIEVRDLFIKYNEDVKYNSIKKYIVVR